MKRIRKAVTALGHLVRNPWLLNKILADQSVWEKHLEKQHGNTQHLPVLDINVLFPDIAETINCFAFLDGGSLPTDIALLKMLCRRFEDCRYFEIGTWRGESVTNVAEVAKDCYTLNLSEKELLQMGADKKYTELHGYFSKSKTNVNYLFGNSMNYDFEGLDQQFDVVFIDGDHHYEYVKNDTEKVFRHLVHKRSIVVWHDYAWHPEKVRSEVLAAILDGTPSSYRPYLYHVSNTMCAIYIPELLPTSSLQAPSIPNKQFTLHIESKPIE